MRFISPLAPPAVTTSPGFGVTMNSGGEPNRPAGCEPYLYLLSIGVDWAPQYQLAPGLMETNAFAQFGSQMGSPGGAGPLSQARATATWSADGRELTTTVNIGPGHDLRCFTAESLTDHLDEPGWFDGLRPVITGCNDGLDNDPDGVRDLRDPECRHGSTETDPSKVATRAKLRVRPIRCGISGRSRVVEHRPSDLVPADGFRFYGRMRIKVRGVSRGVRGVQRGLSGMGTPYPDKRFDILHLRTGRYRVSFLYAGDSWRSPAATVSRTVRVACR